MKEITLTRGKVALVDDADFERANQFKWCAIPNSSGNTWYAIRFVWNSKIKKESTLSLHTFLTGFKRTDHKDGNGLNNCRNNLRPATNRQNAQAKQTKKKNASSKYRGVCWDSYYEKWHSAIRVDGKLKNLGMFDDEIEAAKSYDAAARIYFGEFASPNFTN